MAFFLFYIFFKSGVITKIQPTGITALVEENIQNLNPTSTFTFSPIIHSTLTPTSADLFTITPIAEDATLTPTSPNPYLLTPESPEINYRAPNFSLTDLSRTGTITLSDYLGKPVVVDYWATWCPPCREELPSIQKVYQEYSDQGLVVLGVNNIDNDDINSVFDFVTENNLSFDILLDESNIVIEEYQILYLPTTIFIDRYGVIRDIKIGSISEDEFRDLVQNLISY